MRNQHRLSGDERLTKLTSCSPGILIPAALQRLLNQITIYLTFFSSLDLVLTKQIMSHGKEADLKDLVNYRAIGM